MDMFLDTHTNTLFILRWIHFVAGVLWIGHLWFFNFVNANFAKTLDGDSKKKVVPELMPRALFMFRWGAMFTFLSGYAYLIWKQFIASSAGLMGPGGLFTSSWGWWISTGALFGTIMWFNVWFIIWPNQRKIIGAIKAGTAPDPKLVSTATNASKLNTFLSVPLLFAMAGASHLPVSYGGYWTYLVIALVLGFGAVQLMYKRAPQVSTQV
ncbi:MAG TPA: urate hydroxylase PuuD [Myxococcota bacterium]|jgi:uncharacterized membrane protein|nr:urate hydroxylase PuuD [Myxococcota bacterium]